jgi:hypothetical protein
MRDGIWQPAPPADPAALAELRDHAPIALPVSYIDQLAACNGGQGDLAIRPGFIRFWETEQVIGWNEDYNIPEFLPGFFGFGSDGGLELLAFDARDREPFPIVIVPFVPMEAAQAIQIASSFDELRPLIGKVSDDAA